MSGRKLRHSTLWFQVSHGLYKLLLGKVFFFFSNLQINNAQLEAWEVFSMLMFYLNCWLFQLWLRLKVHHVIWAQGSRHKQMFFHWAAAPRCCAPSSIFCKSYKELLAYKSCPPECKSFTVNVFKNDFTACLIMWSLCNLATTCLW